MVSRGIIGEKYRYLFIWEGIKAKKVRAQSGSGTNKCIKMQRSPVCM